MSAAALDLRPLKQARERLAELGVVPEAAATMNASAREAIAALRSEVLKEVRGFTESGNPSVLPELNDHSKAHVAEIMRLFSGAELGEFEFVRDHARLREEQRF